MQSSILVVTILACCPGLFAAEPEIVFKEGVVYSRPKGKELALNYALPKSEGGPWPVILCIHGGGWRGGNREGYNDLIREAARDGFAAVTVSYRLTAEPGNEWPAQLDDVTAAVKWIHDNADKLDLDVNRIGAVGHSAGGHLSLMLGVLKDATKGEERLVEAVVNYFGPTDVRKEGVYAPGVDPLIVSLAGGPRSERPEVYASISPVTYLTKGDAPILTFHGTADRVVPVSQAKLLHAALGKLGIPGGVDYVEGADHGWGGEQAERTNQKGVAFFESYLRGSDLPLLVAENFDDGAGRWRPTDPMQWKAMKDGGRTFYSLTSEKGAYAPKVRSPRNVAWLDDVVVEDFVFDVSMQYTHKDYGHASLCLFFGYQDSEHFYYVHFGKQADAHANSIFLVDGKPRVSIAKTRTEGTNWDRSWHRARIARDPATGSIEVFFDDMEKPVMTAEDKHFLWGKVGIGSFDDKGNFDTIRLRGKRRSGEGS